MSSCRGDSSSVDGSSQWSVNLLNIINRQRVSSRHLCDVVVCCDAASGDSLAAHRCVLAASSEYFCALFANQQQQQQQQQADEIRRVTIDASLLDVSRHIVEMVLDFMYTGQITLSLATVPEVLRLADFLRMRQLISYCAEYLDSVLPSDTSSCLNFLYLVDTFHLASVSPSLAAHVVELVSQRLPDIFAGRDLDELPLSTINQLFVNTEIGSVRESDIFTALCRRLVRQRSSQHHQYEAADLDLLDYVEFDFLSTAFVRQHVLSNSDVTNWLKVRKPQVLMEMMQRAERYEHDASVDVVVCRTCLPPKHAAVSDASVQLLAYVIQDDEWRRLQRPLMEDSAADSAEPAVRGCDLLSGLESLLTDGPSLYALCTVPGDAVSYVQMPVNVKRFWRLQMTSDRSDCQWQRLPAPSVVQSQCRLTVSVHGVYAVDLNGVVELYSPVDRCWTVLCRAGFPAIRNTTLYVLPMFVDTRLMALRVYASGFSSINYSSRSVVLYALDTDRAVWNSLDRSDIDMVDLLAASNCNMDAVNFHNYVSTPSAVRLLDELGVERASFDLVASDWILPSGTGGCSQSDIARPRFVGSVLGSAAHAGRVFCACLSGVNFVMYDALRRRFKATTQPLSTVSGVICHATMSRPSLQLLTDQS